MKKNEDTIKEVIALIENREYKYLDRIDCAYAAFLSLYFKVTNGKDKEYVDELDKHILRLLNGFKLVLES